MITTPELSIVLTPGRHEHHDSPARLEEALRDSGLSCERVPVGDGPGAVRTALLACTGRYVWWASEDGLDPQLPTQALPLLRSGEAELVLGSRALAPTRSAEAMVRAAPVRAAGALLRLALDYRGTDALGPRLYLRSALLEVLERCHAEDALLPAEMVVRAGRRGRRLMEMPIPPPPWHLPAGPQARHWPLRAAQLTGRLARLGWALRTRSP